MTSILRNLFGAVAAWLALAGAARADLTLPANCTTPLDPDCLYQTAVPPYPLLDVGEVELLLIDPARANFRVPIKVRYLKNTSYTAPVVIWHHGGEPRFEGRDANLAWSLRLVRAGYVVVHPSRNLIPASQVASFNAVCTNNGVTGVPTHPFDENCREFVSHSLYGPRNTNFVISRLTTTILPAMTNFTGTLDTANIAVAGHSGGTSIVLSNAGARRQFKPGGQIFNQRSSSPKAFIAAAPFGPDNAGFYYSLFANHGGFSGATFGDIDSRPLLSITGKGDEGPNVGNGQEVVSEARTFAFRQATPGNKLLSWDLALSASHGTMGLSDCGAALAFHCDAIANLAIAFLDAHLKNRQEARDWLAQDGYEMYTGGILELHRR
jgi:hypothetical protein